jgi:hypothetical protein
LLSLTRQDDEEDFPWESVHGVELFREQLLDVGAKAVENNIKITRET